MQRRRRQQRFDYPATRRADQVDTYHGTQVADPYRWLEDDNSPETAKWVEAQNTVTFAYLDKIPYRAQLRARLERLYDYPKYSAPSRKRNLFFFYRNEGLQNQSVLYVQQGIDGTPEVLLDPNTWSADGTVRLLTFSPSKDATHAVYGVSRSGSDWEEYSVLDLRTRKPLADKLEWVKVSSVAWRGEGFYYSRYPAPEAGKELSSSNANHRVFYHRLGTPQSADELVFEDARNPQRFHILDTTEDERFAILQVHDRGTGKQGNALFVRDLSRPSSPFLPLVPDITDDTYEVVDNVGDRILVATDRNATNRRVVSIDPRDPSEANWKTVLPEMPEPLESVDIGGRQVVRDLHERCGDPRSRVHPRWPARARSGPARIGHCQRLQPAMRDSTFVFYTFTSFTIPTAIYRYDIADACQHAVSCV